MRRHNFKNLQIWQESMELIHQTYEMTSLFPEDEKYGLKSQMNRCAVSIASNIAEGTSKRTNKHFIKYLEDSLGSAYEWETQLIICSRQNYLSNLKFSEMELQIIQLQKKISRFIDTVESQS